MARGLQAQQSQAKAQEKAAKLKKMQVLSLFFCFEGELQWTTNSGKQQARQRQDGSRRAQVLLRRLQVSLNISNKV